MLSDKGWNYKKIVLDMLKNNYQSFQPLASIKINYS